MPNLLTTRLLKTSQSYRSTYSFPVKAILDLLPLYSLSEPVHSFISYSNASTGKLPWHAIINNLHKESLFDS